MNGKSAQCNAVSLMKENSAFEACNIFLSGFLWKQKQLRGEKKEELRIENIFLVFLTALTLTL